MLSQAWISRICQSSSMRTGVASPMLARIKLCCTSRWGPCPSCFQDLHDKILRSNALIMEFPHGLSTCISDGWGELRICTDVQIITLRAIICLLQGCTFWCFLRGICGYSLEGDAIWAMTVLSFKPCPLHEITINRVWGNTWWRKVHVIASLS